MLCSLSESELLADSHASKLVFVSTDDVFWSSESLIVSARLLLPFNNHASVLILRSQQSTQGLVERLLLGRPVEARLGVSGARLVLRSHLRIHRLVGVHLVNSEHVCQSNHLPQGLAKSVLASFPGSSRGTGRITVLRRW